jgi:hypothetical protein
LELAETVLFGLLMAKHNNCDGMVYKRRAQF